jgi:transposase
MVKRYELTDAQWDRICELLPGKTSDPGRTAADNRLFVNGCLWVLRSGAHWHDLQERYGKWKSVHQRFARWAKSDVWERFFKDLTADRRNDYSRPERATPPISYRKRQLLIIDAIEHGQRSIQARRLRGQDLCSQMKRRLAELL